MCPVQSSLMSRADQGVPCLALGAGVARHFGGVGGACFPARVVELLAHAGVGHGLLQLGAEPGLHVLRRGRGHHQALPGVGLDVREAELPGGGNVGQLRHALGRHGQQRHHLAGLHGAHAAGQVEHHQRDLAAHEVLQRGRAALVGHVQHGHAGLALEQLVRQVMRAAGAGRRDAVLAGRGLERGEQRLRVGDAGVGRGRDDERRAAHHAHEREVFLGVVGQLLVERGVVDQHAVVGREHGIAVARRTRHVLRRDDRARAGLVLDQHRLAHLLRDLRAHGAREKVGAAAGRVADHPAHGLGGVGGLRGCRGRNGQRQCDGRELEELLAGDHVVLSPLICCGMRRRGGEKLRAPRWC